MQKPIRINKYIADTYKSTRGEADRLIEEGKVFVNGKLASLGQKVFNGDEIKISGKRSLKFLYFAFHKSKDVLTHSGAKNESDIQRVIGRKDIFPVGRLDKDSHGLIILTNDGRITKFLLNPEFDHEKEYIVHLDKKISPSFKTKMEKGVMIEGYKTKPCKITVLGPKKFSIILTEGKKHQIRRMCAALGYQVLDLLRTRILNIYLSNLSKNSMRPIEDLELKKFLSMLGI